MEQEYDEANRELQFQLWRSLDRCHEAGAKEDDLKLLAWQCGLSDWTPNAHARSARVGI